MHSIRHGLYLVGILFTILSAQPNVIIVHQGPNPNLVMYKAKHDVIFSYIKDTLLEIEYKKTLHGYTAEHMHIDKKKLIRLLQDLVDHTVIFENEHSLIASRASLLFSIASGMLGIANNIQWLYENPTSLFKRSKRDYCIVNAITASSLTVFGLISYVINKQVDGIEKITARMNDHYNMQNIMHYETDSIPDIFLDAAIDAIEMCEIEANTCLNSIKERIRNDKQAIQKYTTY